MLLNNGAIVNTQGGYHVSALLSACLNGHRSVVNILLRADADVNEEYPPSVISEVPFTQAILAYWASEQQREHTLASSSGETDLVYGSGNTDWTSGSGETDSVCDSDWTSGSGVTDSVCSC
jgi:ankyrin repeat protein